MHPPTSLLLMNIMARPGNARSPVQDEEEWITALQPTDVLFGRGSGPNDHEGNILFRRLVRQRKSEYMATNHRQIKAKIAREIVDTVRAHNGRFLKKVGPAEAKKFGIPKGVEAWCVADDKTVMEKAKQALRQKSESRGSSNSEDEYDEDVEDDEVKPPAAKRRNSSSSDYEEARVTAAPAPLPPSAETLSHFGGDAMDSSPYSQPSGDIRHQNWDTVGRYDQGPMQYLSNASPLAGTGGVGGGFMSEDNSLPNQYSDMDRYRMVEMEQQRLAEMEVHRHAHGGDGVVLGDDDERRRSLQVEDLMRTLHRMGTDEMASSSSNNNNMNNSSTETMGTIEPLPMGGSNISMMSSSTFSILKSALADTPRSSLTRPTNTRQDSYGLRGKMELMGSSGDMPTTLAQVDTLWGGGNSDGRGGFVHHNVSQVIEGNTADEESSRRCSIIDPQSLQMMSDDPDSFSGMGTSSMSYLQSFLERSSDSRCAMGTSESAGAGYGNLSGDPGHR